MSAPATAWRGRELFEREDWELRLDEAAIRELIEAVRANADRPLDSLTPKTFSLPCLAPRLTTASRQLEAGSGATRIRGLPISSFSETELERLLMGIARHLGTPVSQSAAGELILPVRDARFEPGDPRVRGPHTNRRLSFHTDRCDVIGFLCVRTARAGGENDVLSSMALFEEMRARHPDQLRVLQEPFPYLRHTVDAGNERHVTLVPVFTSYRGHFAASFLRVLIDRADRDPSGVKLSDAQREALDTLESVAEDDRLFARFRLEPGDLLLLNNWVTFHRRAAFEDHDELERQRLLLRVWLSTPNSRPLDPRFADHFGTTTAGAVRGGMRPA